MPKHTLDKTKKATKKMFTGLRNAVNTRFLKAQKFDVAYWAKKIVEAKEKIAFVGKLPSNNKNVLSISSLEEDIKYFEFRLRRAKQGKLLSADVTPIAVTKNDIREAVAA